MSDLIELPMWRLLVPGAGSAPESTPAPEHVNAKYLRPLAPECVGLKNGRRHSDPPHQLSDVSLLKAVNCLMFDDDC